jgi:GTP:adenosylcobinamide-phosphate guanylyltransferase
MDAVVLAGGIPGPDDPLYPYTQGEPKALVDIAGKPMAQWVLDAIGHAKQIDQALIVGVDSASALTCKKPLHFLPDHGHILENAKAGLRTITERNPKATHFLLASSDIPSVTSEIVDWRVEESSRYDVDIDYVVVDRETMESRFPEAQRTFVQLKDHELCGGDLNIVRNTIIQKEQLWQRIIAARKNVFKQASLVGFDLLFLLLTRQLTLEGAERRVCRKLGLTGRACLSPFAELAMDMDKPHQLELLRKDLTPPSRESPKSA